ncbi:MAG TPA: tetratricopeptide repeat protein [Tepidisphaeraceae bacterium]|jgi:tetratricopeptide (TPR) repeat protein
MRTHFSIALILAGYITVCGCADKKDQGGIQPVGQADANVLNASHSRFDTPQDPPFTADTRYAAGQLAESQGAAAAAIDQYNQALKLDPKHQASLYRLAVLYTQARDYPQAIESWKQYVKATNSSATAYSNLAFCYEVAGQMSEAESAYKSGIEREPKNSPCRINYGLMLARTGRIQEGMSQLAEVLSPAEVHYNVASVYEQQGRTDDAREEYQKALDLDPKLWEAQSRLSKLDD